MITVIGDLILDVFEYGESSRMSPEAPVPIITPIRTVYAPGGAANVAQNIHDLNCNVNLIGIVGDDQNSYHLEKVSKNIYVSYIKDLENPTIAKKRIIANNQQIARIDVEGKFNPLIISDYVGEETQYVVISDYNKGTIGDCSEEFLKLRKRNIRVLVDPKKELHNYRGAWLVKPNKVEFETYVGKFKDRTELIGKAVNACRTFDIQYMLVTLGSEGMTLVSKQGVEAKVETDVTEVYDITGAGDSAMAGLVYGLINNNDLIESVHIANRVAQVAVSHPGTYSVKEKDIKPRTVFTNGCFDVLHLGHLKLLKFAKKQGDKLIVAINSDASVKRLKGDGRPKFSQEDRKSMLESLEVVDEVIIFDEDTPYDLIKSVRPDVIVKGGDYTVETTVGNDLAEVIIFPRIKDYSTTKILEGTL